MRPLDIDYLRSARRARLAVYVLAAFAVVFAADTLFHYRTIKTELVFSEARQARQAELRTRQPPKVQESLSADEYAFVRDTAKRLSTPWDELFQALGAAQVDRVALLAIEPDVENRTVSISAEAKDYLAALTYVANLGEQKTLRRVHLVHHELKQGASQRPLAFTVSASWRENR